MLRRTLAPRTARSVLAIAATAIAIALAACSSATAPTVGHDCQSGVGAGSGQCH
jgi:outer membrane protein assembly factor BamE (lipoprotein component of BamABCDE complex)